jgi:DNA-binding CsgD family transcriptional regulator
VAVGLGPLAHIRHRRALAEAGLVGEARAALAAQSMLGSVDPPTGIDDQVTLLMMQRHCGELTQATAQASLMLGLLPDTAHLPRAVINVCLADVEVLLGRVHDATERLDAARETLAAKGCGEMLAMADWVRARVHCSLGEHEDALTVLRSAAGRRFHLYGPDLVVALHRLGDEREALRIAQQWSDVPVREAFDPLVASRVLRAQGEVTGDLQLFRDAAAVASAAGLACEVMATWDHAHHWSLPHGDGALTSELLEHYRDACGLIGVRPRSDSVVGGDSDDLAASLTPAEFRVAAAVGAGLSNKEAATSLYISVKTVDFHLQAIYRKLNIRSRTELAVLVSKSRPLAVGGVR